MDHIETLNTIAQIAISLIGFSGIVVVFGDRDKRSWTQKETLQFISLLAPALTALFCSFTPIILNTIIEDPKLVWRISNAILGIFHLSSLSYFILKVKFATLSQKFLGISGVVMLIGHLLAAVNFSPWVEFIFIVGLLQQILIGINNFILLFTPMNKKNV